MLQPGPTTVVETDPVRRESAMASNPLIRADAFDVLPPILVMVMLVLASLGIVAQAAAA